MKLITFNAIETHQGQVSRGFLLELKQRTGVSQVMASPPNPNLTLQKYKIISMFGLIFSANIFTYFK